MPPKKRARSPAAPEPKAAPQRKSARLQKQTETATEEASSIGKWVRHDTLLYLDSPEFHTDPPKGIIGFDMDSTLVETRTGKVHATARNDWKWLFENVPETLKKLHGEGKRIVIFTNQGGINGKNGWDSAKQKQIEGKIQDLSAELGFPLMAFIATSDDKYRKPATLMWDFMVQQFFGEVTKDTLANSAYVGDAAGRPADWKPGVKKDFSCSDRKFAHNIGITFQTPEEYFQGEAPAPFSLDGAVDPNTFTFSDKITEDGETSFHKAEQEIVIFCGFPASGKSTFATRYFIPHGYVHVNRDTLKTPKKCYTTAEQAIAAGKSVVIDNTMPKFKSTDKEGCSGREAYVQLAKDRGIPVRLFHFQTSEELAKHLNMYRERLTGGESPHVPRIGYNVFKRDYEEPKLAEGYTEIKKIHFVPKFDSKEAEALFSQLA